MKITIVGTGYVGLVTGTCFAEVGIDVTCVDIDVKKIENLKRGIIPIYEPGLEPMVLRNVEKGRLHFSTDLKAVIQEGTEVVFSAVGTPPDDDGSADLKYVLDVARTVGKSADDYVLLVTKSTVPVGTAEKVRKVLKEELTKRGLDFQFDVASNPEFLKEGDALNDFLKPDRIVCGVDSARAEELFTRLYKPFT
ncbi:MAG: UDP-glucose 6-dehydrogenase, partial [Bacteroidetes bacterium HGW-Bacteroidetes-22]